MFNACNVDIKLVFAARKLDAVAKSTMSCEIKSSEGFILPGSERGEQISRQTVEDDTKPANTVALYSSVLPVQPCAS